jgi:endonuclease YncB( thermonuclease family)
MVTMGLFAAVWGVLGAAVVALTPPLPPPPPDLRSRTPDEVLVIDGQTLEIRAAPIRLLGVLAPDRSQQCQGGGRFWACGAMSRAALAELVKGQNVYCQIAGEQKVAQASRYDPLVGRCFVGRTDLAQTLVDQGQVLAVSPSPYAGLALQACVAARGVWAGRFEAPWTFRRRREGVLVSPLMIGAGSSTPCAKAVRP